MNSRNYTKELNKVAARIELRDEHVVSANDDFKSDFIVSAYSVEPEIEKDLITLVRITVVFCKVRCGEHLLSRERNRRICISAFGTAGCNAFPHFVVDRDVETGFHVVKHVLNERHDARSLGERQACITRLHRFDDVLRVDETLAQAEFDVADCDVRTRAHAVENCVDVD